jgi:hypothetical protein
MSFDILFRLLVLVGIVALGYPAAALPVDYRFDGLVTGDSYVDQLYDPVRLTNAHFEVSVFGDTENAARTPYIAGVGPGYANHTLRATWAIEGFGVATSNVTEVFDLPGLGRLGFVWDGRRYSEPFDPNGPAGRLFAFDAIQFGSDTDVYQLASLVAGLPVTLQTDLRTPNGIPPYQTFVSLPDGSNSLFLESLTSVTYYVVTAAPEPPALSQVLIAAAILATSFAGRHTRWLQA